MTPERILFVQKTRPKEIVDTSDQKTKQKWSLLELQPIFVDAVKRDKNVNLTSNRLRVVPSESEGQRNS